MNTIQTLAAAVVAGAPMAMLVADQPPTGVKTIVEIVEQLEQSGYGPFIEISFDDGFWEVEVYKKDAPVELAVDSHNGKILAEYRDDAEPRPPQGSQPLSKILHGLNQAGHSTINEVSFERRYWEIETLRDDGEHEIHVDPKTGEIINDRRDD